MANEHPTYETPAREVECTPGTFIYAGFGMGTLYLEGGKEVERRRSEAMAECAERGVEFRFVDSLEGYDGSVSLSD